MIFHGKLLVYQKVTIKKSGSFCTYNILQPTAALAHRRHELGGETLTFKMSSTVSNIAMVSNVLSKESLKPQQCSKQPNSAQRVSIAILFGIWKKFDAGYLHKVFPHQNNSNSPNNSHKVLSPSNCHTHLQDGAPQSPVKKDRL